jgi:ATP-dependent Clp protease ATP-binding subunit ClpA
LATETRAVEADDLAAAFKSSLHKPLARRMAVALTRQPPCGCIVWAASGAGKGHLLRATAHILLHAKVVSNVRHLSAARLTCGHVFPTERDGVLTNLLDELVERPRLLLLADHLDLGISGTAASVSLLAEALDRGARMLATVDGEDFLRFIQEIPLLARRLLPVRVPSLNQEETLRALQHLVRAGGYDVSPAALLAAVEITERRGAIQPAAAIDLLSAAMAEAHWRSHKTITPDDVTSVLSPDWPQ